MQNPHNSITSPPTNPLLALLLLGLSQLLARQLLNAFCCGLLLMNMYKFGLVRLSTSWFRLSVSGQYYLLPLIVPCIGEAAGGVLEAGLRKVSGKA